MNTIKLHNGPLAFSAREIGSGPVVLFLHGFPDIADTFDAQMEAAADAGFRAVSVNLRGYEPSSQPDDNDYTRQAIAGDIVGFISELGDTKVHLVGHDWGAAIAYQVGAQAPSKLLSLVALSLPHPGRFLNDMAMYPSQLKLSWYIMFFQIPVIAEYFVKRNNYEFIRMLWRNWSPGWSVPDTLTDNIISQLKEPGVLNAALRYYRTALSWRELTPKARADARFAVGVPTLAISGAQDKCIDTLVFEKMMVSDDFPQGLEFHRMQGVGHFPHLEKTKAVNELILDWIKRH